MKKKLFTPAIIASTLFFTACSGSDDSTVQTNNTDTSQLMGKWIIYKAQYGDTEPFLYESDGDCGKETLEFYSGGEVVETIYVDANCMNGGSGSYSWWTLNNGNIAFGAENSYHHTVTVNGNNLILDAREEADYIKYYNRAD